MKLSFNWLKEYIDPGVTAEELAEGLTMSGSEVEDIAEHEGDKVMSLEITSNRPDCLNIIGLAREASAVFDKDLKLPDLSGLGEQPASSDLKAGCRVDDADLCPRYTARVITGVSVKKTGRGISGKLLALGLREVNNVVDVTNYCLMELGQPLHAFDLDRIKGGKVIVRGAKKGEKITTIDDEERALQPGMLVIADAERPIAVAGVMGGKDTEVTASTKNILLESAYFDPVSIRRTARALGLSSDSSYRFERGVDKGMVLPASDRAARLIVSEAGGEICELYDEGRAEAAEVEVEFDVQKAGRTLGIELDAGRTAGILSRLGMSARGKGGALTVGIPSFREDLKREIDLVEEVARIYGYDKIPPTIPRPVASVVRKERERRIDEKLRGILAAAGLNEIMTYSLISARAAAVSPDICEGPVELANPLSEEQKVLTTQLLDGMLKAVSWNINRTNKDLNLFELGKVYKRARGKKAGKKETPYQERPALCAGMTGLIRKNWEEGPRPAGLFDIKGLVEEVLYRFRINAGFEPVKIKGLENSAAVKIDGAGEASGFIGQAGQRLLEEYDIPQPVFLCHMDLTPLMEKSSLAERYHAVPRFPSSSRDVSVLCESAMPAGDIVKVIDATGEDLVNGVELVDIYEGEQIPAGKKSLTYSIEYGLETRTLTDEEIEGVHSRIKQALQKELKVSFR